jgi:hypothetical protein
MHTLPVDTSVSARNQLIIAKQEAFQGQEVTQFVSDLLFQ